MHENLQLGETVAGQLFQKTVDSASATTSPTKSSEYEDFTLQVDPDAQKASMTYEFRWRDDAPRTVRRVTSMWVDTNKGEYGSAITIFVPGVDPAAFPPTVNNADAAYTIVSFLTKYDSFATGEMPGQIPGSPTEQAPIDHLPPAHAIGPHELPATG